MQHWKTAFLTLVIFGLGGVGGGLVTAQIIKRKIEVVNQSTPGPEVIRPEWIPQTVQVMRRQLNLTPEQVEQVRDIMIPAQREMVRQREEFRLRTRNAMARADEAVFQLLTEEQKPLFEEFKKNRALRMKQRFPNGQPPRPGDRPEPRRENPPFGPNRPQGEFRQPVPPPGNQTPPPAPAQPESSP